MKRRKTVAEILTGLPITQDLHQRFMALVSPEPNSGCWLWSGKVYGSIGPAYGRLQIGGEAVAAHRLSFKIHNGVDPGESLVCHACDQSLCVNPAHLWLGTSADNIADKVSKGRQWRGGRKALAARKAPRGQR